MNDYIIYNSQNHVVICRQHGCGIPRDWIARHFREQHKETPLETRSQIVEHVKSLDLWEPELVMTRHDGTYIKGLHVNIGYQCQYEECMEIYGTTMSIKKHCKKTHQWTAADGIKWLKQSYQTIFQHPRSR